MAGKRAMLLIVLTFLTTIILTSNVEASGGGSFAWLETLLAYLVIEPVVRIIFVLLPIHYWISTSGISFANNFDMVILYNPPIEGILPFMNIMMKILFPVYSLLILAIGFYLILCSSSPEGRANAKSMLLNLVITLVLISLSPQLMSVIFSISQSLAEGIFSLTNPEIIKMLLGGGLWGIFTLTRWLSIPDMELGVIPHMLVYLLAWFPYMVISLRNIMLTALMILFPMGIILHIIPGLKGIGQTIIEQFLIWTFLQAFMSLTLVSVVKVFMATKFVSNPSITWANFCPIPGCNNLLSWVFTSMGWGSVDLKLLIFGLTAYVVVTLSPIIMVMLFKKFLH